MNEAFEQAALALTGVISDPARVTPKERVEIVLEAPSLDLLLVDWLNRLIYEMSTRHMLFGAFEVDIEKSRLRAQAWGERVQRRKHRPAIEVKAATYYQAAVKRNDAGEWIAQCVVDV